MQERRPTRRAKRRGRKRIAFSIVMLGLVVSAHHLLASLEITSMAALEQNSAAKKIGMLAAQAAARARQNGATGFRELQNDDRNSLPGPAAAGLAMRLSGSPALQARFRQIQKATSRALNKASTEGRKLSTLVTPLPAVIGTRGDTTADSKRHLRAEIPIHPWQRRTLPGKIGAVHDDTLSEIRMDLHQSLPVRPQCWGAQRYAPARRRGAHNPAVFRSSRNPQIPDR